MQDRKLFECPALAAIRVISGKWKTRILWLLRERPMHFGELRKTLNVAEATEIVRQLDQTYSFLSTKLMIGNTRRDISQLLQVADALSQIRSGWAELFDKLKTEGALPTATMAGAAL